MDDQDEGHPLIKKKDDDGDVTSHETLPKANNSWLSTGVQVLNTMLGSGILAFPYVLAKSGIFLFTVNILFTVIVVLCTSWMLITAGKKMKIMNYSLLTEAVFGKTMRQLLNVGIVLSSVGSILSYLNGTCFLYVCVSLKPVVYQFLSL
jgi:amino acid permease